MERVKVENYKSEQPWQRKNINVKKETFRVMTPGLEEVFFKHVPAHDAANFKDTKISCLVMPLLIISMAQLQVQCPFNKSSRQYAWFQLSRS